MRKANSIQEVIDILENIIQECKKEGNPLGYFAALYQNVTINVASKIGKYPNNESVNHTTIPNQYFDNDERMEKLDVVFANRYIEAYYDYQEKKKVTNSWKVAFELSQTYWAIVLQHLLIGMNAHINLDLGIAAAQISTSENIADLKDDFNKINELLGSLVEDVENDLATIWPTLKWFLKISRNIDNFLVDFSMSKARDGAWKFANEIVGLNAEDLEKEINNRDNKIANLGKMVTSPGIIVSFIFGIIRLSERRSISQRIELLEAKNKK